MSLVGDSAGPAGPGGGSDLMGLFNESCKSSEEDVERVKKNLQRTPIPGLFVKGASDEGRVIKRPDNAPLKVKEIFVSFMDLAEEAGRREYAALLLELRDPEKYGKYVIEPPKGFEIIPRSFPGVDSTMPVTMPVVIVYCTTEKQHDGIAVGHPEGADDIKKRFGVK